jgi:UDPglucose 6-dehydrogenase
MRPDRVVIGTLPEAERAKATLRELYRPLYLLDTPVLFTGIETAELIKYAANSFLATKITFINEMADLCEKVGADVQDIAKGIGLDGRIGPKFLHAGPGYGGSCFPKDCLALIRTAREAQSPVTIIETVAAINDKRKTAMAERIVQACGGDVAGLRIAILGLTFKPNTDDMRDAPSLAIIPALIEQGATVRAYDPQGMQEAARLMPGMETAADVYDALKDAQCLAILTEWNAFRSLDWNRVASLMKGRAVVDLRNIYQPQRVAKEGFTYHSIGRPTARP